MWNIAFGRVLGLFDSEVVLCTAILIASITALDADFFVITIVRVYLV